MKRRWPVLGLVVVLVVALASSAYPWGYATHAYIANLLNKKVGQRNLNEIYGAMAPDMFNLRFDLPVYGEGGLYSWTHYGYDKVWAQKETGMSKGLGYGFVSHNDWWGADSTAHHWGRTHGMQEGYVIAKAIQLGETDPALAGLVGPDLALELQHVFVEYAGDILTKRLDPTIGEKITAAALGRSSEFPWLLVAAYAEDFAPILYPLDATQVILIAEAEFSYSMAAYGQILMLDEDTARTVISEYLAQFAEQYLAANGVELPVEPEELPGIINYYLDLAMGICEADYPVEIAATVDYVDEEMAARKIGNQR